MNKELEPIPDSMHMRRLGFFESNEDTRLKTFETTGVVRIKLEKHQNRMQMV